MGQPPAPACGQTPSGSPRGLHWRAGCGLQHASGPPGAAAAPAAPAAAAAPRSLCLQGGRVSCRPMQAALPVDHTCCCCAAWLTGSIIKQTGPALGLAACAAEYEAGTIVLMHARPICRQLPTDCASLSTQGPCLGSAGPGAATPACWPAGVPGHARWPPRCTAGPWRALRPGHGRAPWPAHTHRGLLISAHKPTLTLPYGHEPCLLP